MLALRHTVHNGRSLHQKTCDDVLWRVHRLLGVKVKLEEERV